MSNELDKWIDEKIRMYAKILEMFKILSDFEKLYKKDLKR